MTLFTRRGLFRASAGALSIVLGQKAIPAQAVQDCYQPTRCDSKIATGSFPHVTQPFGSNFCWAATISMICQWYGHHISIDDVVTQTFGVEANLPADPVTLINAVNRSYLDEGGVAFSLSARIWSALHDVADIDNATIISELNNNHPLVVCNRTHMMALVGVSYPAGSAMIDKAWVADPAIDGIVTGGIPGLPPLAAGFRYLFPSELMPAPEGGELTFVAAVTAV